MGWFDTLCEGMGLNKERRAFLLRALWVIIVSGHIAWVCGFLAGVGLASPFVRAGDLDAKYADISAKQTAADVRSARIESLLQKQLLRGKATEIREVLLQICVAKTSAEKDRLISKKDDLQNEYRELSGGAGFYTEPPCELLR